MSVVVEETVLTTCPRDCYDGCGVPVRLRNGAIKHLRGDPNHPVSRGVLCVKCAIGYKGVWRDPNARLSRALHRNGPKGSGRLEPVSWATALETIAARLGEITAGSGL